MKRWPLVFALALLVFPAAASTASVKRASTKVGDYGVLQRFAPHSATTWWAIVESNIKPKSFVVRTTDSARHRRKVLS